MPPKESLESRLLKWLDQHCQPCLYVLGFIYFFVCFVLLGLFLWYIAIPALLSPWPFSDDECYMLGRWC